MVIYQNIVLIGYTTKTNKLYCTIKLDCSLVLVCSFYNFFNG